MFLLIGKKHFHTQSNQSLQSEMLVIYFGLRTENSKTR